MTISFHRLAAPSYIGGLPTGYDYLNDPVTNAFPGATSPAPADTGPLSVAPSPNLGTYFVGFGEDGRAYAANRGFFALGTNTDFIDNFLHSNLAVLASVDIGVGNPAVITGTSSNPVFVGPPGTTNNAAGLEPYFHVTDQNNNDIVDASNVQCVVTAASGGVGTFFVGALTLTLSIAPSVPYRVWYGTRSSLIEMTKGNLIRSSVWGIARKPASLFQFANDLLSTSLSKGATTVGINTTGFTDSVVTALNRGGIGSAGISTVRDAFLAVDTALIRRRAFMAVCTDGTTSVGGDLNNPILDSVFSTFSTGTFFIRPGDYVITDGAGSTSAGDDRALVGDARGSGITLDVSRSTDFTLNGRLDLDYIGLQSNSSTHSRFIASPQSFEGFQLKRNGVQSGALSCEDGSGGYFVLEDALTFGPPLGSSVAALQVQGEARVAIRRCMFSGDSNAAKNVFLTGFSDDTQSSVLVEDTYFQAFEDNIDAITLQDVTVPVTFRNCVFEVTTHTGSGYAVRLINNNASVIFENCVFRSENGLCFWSAGSLTHLKGCRFISADDHPGAAAGQMVMINGDVNGLLSTVRDCSILIGANSVFGNSGAIQKAIVEIGGTDNFNAADRPILVDGLYITYSGSVPQVHNFCAVVLHGGFGSVAGTCARTYKNITFNTNSISPNNSGTLGGVYRPIASYPTFVTIGGGDTRASTIVDGLHILSVSNPTVDTNHQVLFAIRATLKNVSVDGSLFSASNKYTRDLVEFSECDIYDLNLWRTANLSTNQSHLLFYDTTRIKGGEFIGRVTIDPFSYIQYGGAHCVLHDFTIQFPSIGTTSTAPVVNCPQQCCEMANCRVNMDGNWGGRLVNFPAGSDLARLSNNWLFWRRNAGQILLSTGAGSMVNDNVMASTNTGAPTYVVSGSNSVDSNNSAFLQGGSVANPL
jgi:hypothetical protein